MDDDGSTIKPTAAEHWVSRDPDLSLSPSLSFLSPSMIPFRSPFPFFSPRKTNYPSDHRLVAGKQETRKKRWKTRNVRTTNYPWIHRATTFFECSFTNAVISVHCYRCLPWDYTGVNIQGVLLSAGAVRQGFLLWQTKRIRFFFSLDPE